jgi:hypothetical protein
MPGGWVGGGKFLRAVLFIFCEISGQALVWETISSNNAFVTLIAVLLEGGKEQKIFLQDVAKCYSSRENNISYLLLNKFVLLEFLNN